jgi:hypothetical protein
MPGEIVSIDLSCPFPYQAGAKFIATLAYPHSADRALRDRFLRALCRWQVLKRSIEERSYAANPQLITPAIFVDDCNSRTLRHGFCLGAKPTTDCACDFSA